MNICNFLKPGKRCGHTQSSSQSSKSLSDRFLRFCSDFKPDEMMSNNTTTELNVDTAEIQPILHENETLNGMLSRFVEIKRDQYKWISSSEETLRTLWNVSSDSKTQSHPDLPLRQTLLRLKRDFSRTIKAERELLRNFSIACGLTLNDMPKYYFRGYDHDSPVAKKQRERVAAFAKSEADESKPLRLMRKLRSILPYRKVESGIIQQQKELESLRSETKRLQDLCAELTKESTEQKERLLEKHGALRMKYEDICRELLKEREVTQLLRKDYEWHTTRLNTTIRVHEEKISQIMNENERLRARVERDSNLPKDLIREQDVFAQQREILRRSEAEESVLRNASMNQTEQIIAYETEYERLKRELSNECSGFRELVERSQYVENESMKQVESNLLQLRNERETNQLLANEITKKNNQILFLQNERENSQQAEIEITSLRSRVEIQAVREEKHKKENEKLRKDSIQLDEVRNALSVAISNHEMMTSRLRKEHSEMKRERDLARNEREKALKVRDEALRLRSSAEIEASLIRERSERTLDHAKQLVFTQRCALLEEKSRLRGKIAESESNAFQSLEIAAQTRRDEMKSELEEETRRVSSKYVKQSNRRLKALENETRREIQEMEAIQLERRERKNRQVRAEAANMLCEQDEIYECMQRDVNTFLESILEECTSRRVAEDVAETVRLRHVEMRAYAATKIHSPEQSTERVRDAVLVASRRALSIQQKQCERTQRQERERVVEETHTVSRLRQEVRKEVELCEETVSRLRQDVRSEVELREEAVSRLRQDAKSEMELREEAVSRLSSELNLESDQLVETENKCVALNLSSRNLEFERNKLEARIQEELCEVSTLKQAMNRESLCARHCENEESMYKSLHRTEVESSTHLSCELTEMTSKLQIKTSHLRRNLLRNLLQVKRKRLLRYAMGAMIRSKHILSSLEIMSRRRRRSFIAHFFKAWQLSGLCAAKRERQVALEDRTRAQEAFTRDRAKYKSAVRRLRDDYQTRLEQNQQNLLSQFKQHSVREIKHFELTLTQAMSRFKDKITDQSDRVNSATCSLSCLGEELLRAKQNLHLTKRKLVQAREEAELNMKKYEDTLTHMRIVEASAERRRRRWIGGTTERKEQDLEEEMKEEEQKTVETEKSSTVVAVHHDAPSQQKTPKRTRRPRVRIPDIAIQKSESGASPSMRASNIRKSIFDVLSHFD